MSVSTPTRPVTPTRATCAASRVRPARTHLRRRVAVLVLAVLLVSVLTVALDRVGAEAGLDDPVAGHVVVAPGETLWDVAVATAPDGVDPRRQLRSLRALNGIDGAHLDAWAVVLVPAR